MDNYPHVAIRAFDNLRGLFGSLETPVDQKKNLKKMLPHYDMVGGTPHLWPSAILPRAITISDAAVSLYRILHVTSTRKWDSYIDHVEFIDALCTDAIEEITECPVHKDLPCFDRPNEVGCFYSAVDHLQKTACFLENMSNDPYAQMLQAYIVMLAWMLLDFAEKTYLYVMWHVMDVEVWNDSKRRCLNEITEYAQHVHAETVFLEFRKELEGIKWEFARPIKEVKS